jgi:hypothetical protein
MQLDPAGGTILQRLNAAISVYYNYTGEVQCFNTSVFMTSAASDVAWDYQVEGRGGERGLGEGEVYFKGDFCVLQIYIREVSVSTLLYSRLVL